MSQPTPQPKEQSPKPYTQSGVQALLQRLDKYNFAKPRALTDQQLAAIPDGQPLF